MPSQESLNCEKLRNAFEGREALYIEKGVLRVRVSNIKCNADRRWISATVEEIATKGLEQSFFHSRQANEQARLLRWNIGAGYLTSFSDHTWHTGYGAWTLFFAPEIVNGFVSLAAGWPIELDALERYNQALGFLMDQGAYKPTIRVFPEESADARHGFLGGSGGR